MCYPSLQHFAEHEVDQVDPNADDEDEDDMDIDDPDILAALEQLAMFEGSSWLDKEASSRVRNTMPTIGTEQRDADKHRLSSKRTEIEIDVIHHARAMEKGHQPK
ncbi:hypothetical protein MRX96_027160 [Rhipicephalus microplus]